MQVDKQLAQVGASRRKLARVDASQRESENKKKKKKKQREKKRKKKEAPTRGRGVAHRTPRRIASDAGATPL